MTDHAAPGAAHKPTCGDKGACAMQHGMQQAEMSCSEGGCRGTNTDVSITGDQQGNLGVVTQRRLVRRQVQQAGCSTQRPLACILSMCTAPRNPRGAGVAQQ